MGGPVMRGLVRWLLEHAKAMHADDAADRRPASQPAPRFPSERRPIVNSVYARPIDATWESKGE